MILRVLAIIGVVPEVVPAIASDVDALIGIGGGVATVIGLAINCLLLFGLVWRLIIGLRLGVM